MLDGDRVMAGDTVWDLLLGAGRVEEVTPDGGFSVRFGTRRTLRYTQDGYFVGVKRVYWFNPVITTPRKGRYDRLEFARAVIAVIDQYHGT
ncbi:hypothetical protein [Paraburkholderia dinghuensis]|uniref:Uncharacterized protein n=1 Tax=Paraburkholderia dinghuensis TaxID=2305225 RepID=A0A3N6Q2V5_9BURK|nr:hypothetical protein [Paraburkholderia dinghuensis]RQH06636.1 hypothetical protein D1Y85_12245 [Paraburkholderia dinghuensis]